MPGSVPPLRTRQEKCRCRWCTAYGCQVLGLLYASQRQDPQSYTSRLRGCSPALSQNDEVIEIGRIWPPWFEGRTTREQRFHASLSGVQLCRMLLSLLLLRTVDRNPTPVYACVHFCGYTPLRQVLSFRCQISQREYSMVDPTRKQLRTLRLWRNT